MAEGYVYILTNEAMPGIVKIGKTTRSVEARAAELYQTGVPTPFKIAHQVYSPNCAELESIVHDSLKDCRINAGREFFLKDVAAAIRVMDGDHHEQVVCVLDKYLPGYAPVIAEMMVDESIIHISARDLGAHPFEIATALNFIMPEEIEVLYNRYKEKMQALHNSTEKSQAMQ